MKRSRSCSAPPEPEGFTAISPGSSDRAEALREGGERTPGVHNTHAIHPEGVAACDAMWICAPLLSRKPQDLREVLRLPSGSSVSGTQSRGIARSSLNPGLIAVNPSGSGKLPSVGDVASAWTLSKSPHSTRRRGAGRDRGRVPWMCGGNVEVRCAFPSPRKRAGDYPLLVTHYPPDL